MRRYATLAAAFSYPDDAFFGCFPDLTADRQSLAAEYDRLFRAGVVWLYGAEYLVENEFQRATMLSDIMGFYTAFGMEPNKERADSVTCELEFMYGLIFKSQRLCQGSETEDAKEKADVCRDAEKKFFIGHLDPEATAIAEKIIAQSGHSFYLQAAEELAALLETEREYFNCAAVKGPKQQ